MPKKSHQNNIVYKYKCPVNNCNASYIGETSRRLKQRITEHQYRDKNSHILKHCMAENHPPAEEDNFSILSSNFTYYKERKISEAIYIANEKPSLNIQEQSIPLKLFN